MAKTRSALTDTTTGPEVDHAIDWVYFIAGGVAAVWFAWVLVRESFSFGWWQILFVILFWGALAYLVLPRLHRILTSIYVPDYFIGRARTSDGLLGDPVNLALLGSEAQVHESLEEAGWIRADDLSLKTGLKIVKTTVTRKSYLEAPVSPLLLFGRKQDFAYQQEVDGNPGKRHHVRFWKCPEGWMLPGGHHADWLAAGTYDKSVGFSLFTLQVTHKIAANTDEERDFIVNTVSKAEPSVELRVIQDFSTGYHSRNGGGDSIITDGNLPVLDLRKVKAVEAKEVADLTDSRDVRPSAIVVGAALLAIGALVGVVTGFVDVLHLLSSGVPADLTVNDVEEGNRVVVIVVGIFLVLVAAVQLLLAFAVFRGSNKARVFVMGLNVILVASLIIGAELGDQAAITTNLPSIALSVLVLLCLSSERALTYARRVREPKLIVMPSRSKAKN